MVRFLFFGRILANPEFSSYKRAMQEFDIIIIGAGIAGASVAARLSSMRKVCLFDMEDRAGYHTTSRSAAMYEPNYGPLPMLAFARASKAFLDAPPQGFAPADLLVHRPTLIFMPDGQEAAAEKMLAVAKGLEEISETSASNVYPLLRKGYARRIWRDNDSADIDVDLLHQGFLRQFKANGGTLHLGAAATVLQRNQGQWQVNGAYTAPVIINAAGAWGDEVAKRAGARPVGLQPKRRSIGVIPAPEGVDVSRWAFVNDVAETWYAKPQSGKLIVSSADATPVDPHDAYADDLAIAEGIDRMMQATGIDVERVEHSWGGLRTFSPDGNPVIGFDPYIEGFFWLVGQGGYGIMTSPAISETAAAMVLGRELPQHVRDHGLDPHAIAPERYL
jgi:D-arginine dehydrogenase